ncbi:MAG TPA: PilZ domain-containing protein [Terriglobia bacterium]|nr:PilZ domain-containing protein [Terriglobia bacterium]
MTTSTEEEKRKYPRVEFDSNVMFQCAGQEYVLMARNISAGGLQLDPNLEISSQTQGAVSIPLQPGHPPLACRCRVIYSVEGRGIGVEFLDLSDDSRLVLNNFVRDSD